MTIARRLRTDVAMGDKTAPGVLAQQDADSPGGTRIEETHGLGIEILGVREDSEVGVGPHGEVTPKQTTDNTKETCGKCGLKT